MKKTLYLANPYGFSPQQAKGPLAELVETLTRANARSASPGGEKIPDGTTSMIGPTAALGAHLELDLALDGLLGSRVRTLIRAGQTARQVAPAELRDALKTIADGRTVRPSARRLAVDLAARIEDAMRRQPAPTRITMTLERGQGRPDRDMLVVCPRNDLAVARTWPNGSSNGDSGPNRRNASQIKRQLVQGTHH